MGTKHLNLPLRVTTHPDDRYGIADAAGNQVLPPQHVERTVMKTLVRACNAYPMLIATMDHIAAVNSTVVSNPAKALRIVGNMARGAIDKAE